MGDCVLPRGLCLKRYASHSSSSYSVAQPDDSLPPGQILVLLGRLGLVLSRHPPGQHACQHQGLLTAGS